jgi:hypothetical protein
MVEHRAICGAILWQQRALPLCEDDRVLSISVLLRRLAVHPLPNSGVRGRAGLAEPGEERDPPRLLERVARDGLLSS